MYGFRHMEQRCDILPHPFLQPGPDSRLGEDLTGVPGDLFQDAYHGVGLPGLVVLYLKGLNVDLGEYVERVDGIVEPLVDRCVDIGEQGGVDIDLVQFSVDRYELVENIVY